MVPGRKRRSDFARSSSVSWPSRKPKNRRNETARLPKLRRRHEEQKRTHKRERKQQSMRSQFVVVQLYVCSQKLELERLVNLFAKDRLERPLLIRKD